ncbi:MAG: ATP-binding protein [Treponema sp.]|nr:ATP-binding protein [Treponema sp.]
MENDKKMEEHETKTAAEQTTQELKKEIRSLKRKLALAEINFTRSRQVVIAQDRIDGILHSAFKEEQKFFNLVLENTTNILLLFDSNGRFAYASQTYLQAANIDNFVFLNGKHINEIFLPIVNEEKNKVFIKALNTAISQKKTITLEEEIDFSRSDSLRTYSILITPMQDEKSNNAGIMLLFNDITEQKAMHNEMRRIEIAEESNKAKSQFLARMSHEIRTPMNAILGMTELAIREKIPDSTQEHILAIKQAGSNLLSIINDILDFSKIERGKLEITAEEYRLSSLAIDIINIIKIQAYDSNIRFVVNIDNNLPNILLGDSIRIRQIMLNILNNAVKYTNSGFVSFSINGSVTDDTVNLVIVISDSGRGIKKENLDKIFDEFSQFDTMENKGIEGTGLGLAIALGLTKAMNGTIEVESEYGKGSVFTITLPQKILSQEKFAEIENAKGKNVLIFEQRNVSANSIAQAMRGFGIDYKLAETYEEFYNALSIKRFAYIFISLALYDKVKETYKQLNYDSRIVLISEFGKNTHNENISVITTPIFSIPVANVLNGASDNRIRYEKGISMVKFAAPKAKVLIVDDINTNLRVAKGLMLPYNMQIDLCGSGEEAIEAAKLKHYDLIFMDHMMPGMNGIEAVSYIRNLETKGNHNKKVPIIALTANAVSGTKEMFLKNNFNDFLSKPIDTLKLSLILEKWIPQKKQQKPTTEYFASFKNVNTDENIEIADLDTKQGIKNSGGRFDYYIRILGVFRKDCIGKMKEIEICFEEENLHLYTIYLHALKSASANIGANGISEAAKSLEMAGQNGNINYIRKHHSNFISSLEKLLRKIDETIIEQNKDNQKETINKQTLKNELAALKTAMINFDITSINQTAKKLQAFTQAACFDTISTILRYKLTGEYDKAISLIDELLKQFYA